MMRKRVQIFDLAPPLLLLLLAPNLCAKTVGEAAIQRASLLGGPPQQSGHQCTKSNWLAGSSEAGSYAFPGLSLCAACTPTLRPELAKKGRAGASSDQVSGKNLAGVKIVASMRAKLVDKWSQAQLSNLAAIRCSAQASHLGASTRGATSGRVNSNDAPGQE